MKYAPARQDGLLPYVVTTHEWGRKHDHIEYAADLRDAKAKYGWTKMLHVHMTVRRARVEDMPAEATR